MEEEGEPPAQALEHMPSHNVLLFGSASELDGISLPTSFDILKYYFFWAISGKKEIKCSRTRHSHQKLSINF